MVKHGWYEPQLHDRGWGFYNDLGHIDSQFNHEALKNLHISYFAGSKVQPLICKEFMKGIDFL